MKKKLFAVIMCLALVFAMAVPASAAISLNANNQYIYGWKGTGSAALTFKGVGATMTVQQASVGARNTWSVVTAPHGNYRITYNGYDVNIYRVLQHGVYYNCTAYPYENGTQGRDQRVNIYTANNYSRVQLASPLIDGNWYMVPDKSAASAVSDVIWFTSYSGDRGYWL